MPNGFVGRAPIRYLGDVSVDHAAAQNAAREAFNRTGVNTPVVPLPHRPEQARTGSSVSGRNNSSNIVANQEEYERVARIVSNADNRMANCLQSISSDIEAMCRSTFVLPRTSPQCVEISAALARSLGDFRVLTNEMLAQMNRYAGEIANIS